MKLRMEIRLPTVSAWRSACPLLWMRWEKLKEIKLKILAYFSWMCCVVTEFVYANTIILFILSELWLLEYEHSCFACRWIFCHYLPPFQRIIANCSSVIFRQSVLLFSITADCLNCQQVTCWSVIPFSLARNIQHLTGSGWGSWLFLHPAWFIFIFLLLLVGAEY